MTQSVSQTQPQPSVTLKLSSSITSSSRSVSRIFFPVLGSLQTYTVATPFVGVAHHICIVLEVLSCKSRQQVTGAHNVLLVISTSAQRSVFEHNTWWLQPYLQDISESCTGLYSVLLGMSPYPATVKHFLHHHQETVQQVSCYSEAHLPKQHFSPPTITPPTQAVLFGSWCQVSCLINKL